MVLLQDEVLAGDAGLDGLRASLYGRSARDDLRRSLLTILDRDAVLGRCRLERAKWKPGRKLTGYYLVEVEHPAGRSTRGVEVVWTAGAPPEQATDDERAMEDEARAAGVAGPFVSLRTSTAAAGVRVFPLDVSFRQLVRLATPDHVRDLLAQTYRHMDDNRAASQAYTVSAVRYRPRQRHVLRYQPAGAGTPVFAKLYRDGLSERAVRVAHAVADRVERAGVGVRAVRPLPAPAGDDVVLFPKVDGTPLSGRLWDAPGRHLATAGRLLRALHDAGVGAEAALDLPADDLETQLRTTARAAEHLGPILPRVGERVTAVLDRARDLGAAMPSEPACFAHGDFKSDHVWVSRDTLTLLDFDSCCLAEPALDVGKFLADLTWWFESEGRRGLAAAQAAFLRGYGATSAERLARARVYEAVVLVRLVARRLRRFTADWGRRTEDLVAAASRAIESVAGG